MTDLARYVTIVEPGRAEVRECALPEIGSDWGLLRLEANGVCGSDVDLYLGRGLGDIYPVVPGHEPIGVVERLGADARNTWNIEEGSRLALLAILRCGRCHECRKGGKCVRQQPGEIRAHGFRSAELNPPLWGGMATHMLLSPETEFVLLPDTLDTRVASLYNAMANGVQWAISTGGAGPGDRVVVLGPGPRGLACLVAARSAGASHIVVAGLDSDADRLALAADFGADATVTVSPDDRSALLDDWSGSADLVIDTTPGAVTSVADAITCTRTGGTVVLTGFKGSGVNAPLPVDEVIKRQIVLKSGYSKDVSSTRIAVEILAQGEYPFDRWASHSFPLTEVGAAIDASTGAPMANGQRATHVRIEPWSS
jgi:threonine dehydrogenase-like Zn-dependent dehydrogenase